MQHSALMRHRGRAETRTILTLRAHDRANISQVQNHIILAHASLRNQPESQVIERHRANRRATQERNHADPDDRPDDGSSCQLALRFSTARAETYHVAQGHSRASDANSGTEEAPWKTVSKAAAELLPGDTVLIHTGVYREWVNPARSGSASEPLVFQAAPDETVVLSGADVVSGWVSVEEAIWKKEPWSYIRPD